MDRHSARWRRGPPPSSAHPRPGPRPASARRGPEPTPTRQRRDRPEEPAELVIECVGGLEPFVASDLATIRPPNPTKSDVVSTHVLPMLGGWGALGGAASGELRVRFAGPWPGLLALRTATAVHTVVASGVPRPAALLDDGTLKRLLATIGHIRSLHPEGAFRTLRLSAAGADSPTLRRLRERVAMATGLDDTKDGGHLLLGVRRAPGGEGFELTARISPRPLAARAWRRCNLPGALNATVAAVMADLTRPTAEDVYLNLACGSGTLLVERARSGPVGRLLGCDVDPSALACAAENLAAAGLSTDILQPWDATHLPLEDGSVDTLTVDLPFGQLVGSHGANEQFYPRLLAEAARVACPGARLVAITLQVHLLERSVAQLASAWQLERTLCLTIPTNAAPIAPRVYVLRRSSAIGLQRQRRS